MSESKENTENMTSRKSSFDRTSEPLSRFEYPSSPISGSSIQDQMNNSFTQKEDSPRSVVGSIIVDRQERSANSSKLGLHSSPLAEKLNRIDQRQKLENIRQCKKENKRSIRRGGLEKMEWFVMNGEKIIEENNLKLDADKHMIPVDILAELEKEQEEEMELLEDDDLIEFIEQKEHWEKELEEMMADFSINEN